MQTKAEIEKDYQNPDPWGFQSHPDDAMRKEKILKALEPYGPFTSVLDVGAGEGWITKDIPAESRHGYEISDKAAARFPDNVERVAAPFGKYDLVIATGVLYTQYDYQDFLDIIKRCSSRIVLLCNIKDLEVPEVAALGMPEVHTEEFKYRDYTQKLRVYQLKEKQTVTKDDVKEVTAEELFGANDHVKVEQQDDVPSTQYRRKKKFEL